MKMRILASAAIAACLLAFPTMAQNSTPQGQGQGQGAPRPPVLTSEELAKLPQTPGATVEQERHYYFAEGKVESPYHMYVPKSYDGKKKMPLILALHGAGARETIFSDQHTERLTCSKNTDSFWLRPLASTNSADTEPALCRKWWYRSIQASLRTPWVPDGLSGHRKRPRQSPI